MGLDFENFLKTKKKCIVTHNYIYLLVKIDVNDEAGDDKEELEESDKEEEGKA